MRVIVCGGRHFNDSVWMSWVLGTWNIRTVVHGGASGADRLAGEWATLAGVTEEIHRADWLVHGKAAGPIRNRHMASLGADLCVAFPGGRGTESMVSEAEKALIPVLLPSCERGGMI